MKINKVSMIALEQHYANKMKQEQKVVEEEYNFWKNIDEMAEGRNENMRKFNEPKVKKLNNGGYNSNYSPFTHYPPEIKERLKKIRQEKGLE